ncbi:Isochorismatase [Gracilaria domingensis]|nr:Isochorismatase [Gracilaria domingensis]
MSSSRSALIIVDVQNDFLPTGSLPVPGGDEVIPVINHLLRNIRFTGGVYLSKDWHPSNHKSFASNHPGKSPFEKIIIEIEGVQYEQTLWPDHCVQNSKGAELASNLLIPDNAVIIHKGMDVRYDSYSAFYDNAKKGQTKLGALLKEADVRTLYICGLALDVCVYFTVMNAITLGHDVVLISDASVS